MSLIQTFPSGSSSPSGEGITYTAGNGIIIENNEISTDNAASTDIAEIVTDMPSVQTNLPILFDETSEERVVGWYKNSSGLKKPVYEKELIYVIPTTISDNLSYIILSIGATIDFGQVIKAGCYTANMNNYIPFMNYSGTNLAIENEYQVITNLTFNTSSSYPNSVRFLSNVLNNVSTFSTWKGRTLFAIVQYTKTTDTFS